MDPFGAGAALHRPTPPGDITSAHITGKDVNRVRINVAAHQEKKENEKTSGKRKEKAVDRFPRGCVLAFCGRSEGAARRKMVYIRAVPEVTETLENANGNFDPNQTGSGTAPPRLGRLLIGTDVKLVVRLCGWL